MWAVGLDRHVYDADTDTDTGSERTPSALEHTDTDADVTNNDDSERDTTEDAEIYPGPDTVYKLFVILVDIVTQREAAPVDFTRDVSILESV